MFILLQVLLTISAALSIIIGIFAWQAKTIPGSKNFAILMFAAAEWAICDAISPLFPSVESKLILSQLSYAGILTSILHWTFFIFRFSGNQWVSRKSIQTLGNSLLVLFFIIVMTNEYHHWLYKGKHFSPEHFCLTYEYGPFFWFWLVISYLLLATGTIRMAILAARHETLIRRQVLLLMTAAFLPWTGNVIYIFKLTPLPGFDATPISFTLVGILCLIAIFRSHLFQLVPVAHAWLFRNLDDALIISDPKGLLLEANQRAKDLLKQKLNASDELKTIFERIDPRLVKQLWKNDQLEETQFELDWPHSPEINWIEIKSSQFQISQTNPSLFILQLRDISSFKQQHQRLENNADLLSLISSWADETMKKGWLESIHIILPNLLEKVKANGTCIIQIENGVINRHLAHPTEEELWPIIEKELHSLSNIQNMNAPLNTIEEMGIQWVANPIRRDENTWGYWIWTWPLGIELNQGNLQSLKLAVDILTTSIIREQNLHEIIESKNAAEIANNAKSEFLSIMSHEIRTPLNAIVGISSMLKESLTPEEQHRNVKLLEQSSRNLQLLVSDILDFNKIEAGKLHIENLPVNLLKLTQNVIEENSWKARENGNEIKLVFDESINCDYLTDELRLSQIMNNFVSNATKFTKNGKVDIHVKQLKDTPSTSKILFSVKDTGIGIDENMLSHIFDSFTQAETSTTRRFGGTGLGLAISKQLLFLLHSKPNVSSTLGHGSEFYFELDLEKATPSAELNTATLVDKTSFPGKRVLLAEDNPINAIVTKQYLNKWQMDCDLAQDGEEAVRLMKENSYDLILMDLQMPKMDGKQATKSIRTFNSEIPIIALTASALFDNLDLVLESGMNEFLTKPFEADDLYLKLRNFL